MTVKLDKEHVGKPASHCPQLLSIVSKDSQKSSVKS